MFVSGPAMLSKEPPPIRWLLRKTSSMNVGWRLVGDGGVDEVLLGPGRDDQEGLTGP